MPKTINWLIAATLFLVVVLAGCTSGTASDTNGSNTAFPTATLHPIFSSDGESENMMEASGTAESTTATGEVEATQTPRPATPVVNVAQPTATNMPALAATSPVLNGSGLAVDVPILLYHHIGSPEYGSNTVGYEYFVSSDQFQAQMAYLDENGYTPIDLYTLFQATDETADLPPNPVIITFDDGYTDAYENAFPILEAFDFKATFFLITDFVENGREGYLTWNMVEEMAEAGMRFETHSSTHADLRGQTSDFLIWQVLDSQEILAQHLTFTPRFIAYPFGQVDNSLIQFLETYDFWGGLTAQSGLNIAFDNRFTWPRLFVPSDTPIDAFAELVTKGLGVTYNPGIVEGGKPSSPISVTVSISTTQGAVDEPALLLFDEGLNRDWTVRTSPGVQFKIQDTQDAYTGSVALSYQPVEDFGSFSLQVRPNATTAYLRDDVLGVAFWLYTGDEPLAPDDLALAVTGSNEFPYWSAVDESVDLEAFEPTFDNTWYEFGFNRPISAATWIQVVLYFDDLQYETDYQYITGLNFVNNAGVSRLFLIDELVLILRPQL